MPVAVHAPRINNNDDVVKLIAFPAAMETHVTRGEVVAQVETDKAVVDVESPADGYIIGFVADIDDLVEVGSVLLWVGESKEDVVPQSATTPTPRASTSGASAAVTAKARLLLRRHGLSVEEVMSEGERLTAEDVLRHIALRESTALKVAGPLELPVIRHGGPEVAGELQDLQNNERGMLHTVNWSRDVAAPGYIELEYDATTWESYGKAYAERHRLMFSPLFSLMAWRLTQLAREFPKSNSTIVGEQRYQYGAVNLGFTVQAGDVLYLTVVRDADDMPEADFVRTLGDIQRRATKHKLTPAELTGATISFSSMSRWKVSRHIPVLPPYSALIVAHAESGSGVPVLGATYDHRVLNGSQVISILRKLGEPNDSGEK